MLTRAKFEEFKRAGEELVEDEPDPGFAPADARFATSATLACFDGEKFVSWEEWEARLPNVPHYEDPRSIEMRKRYEAEIKAPALPAPRGRSRR
jgi:hypothetical protein